MKDLISLHVALPDAIEGEMINIRKMAQLSLIIHELEELQNSPTPIDVNMDLVNTLRVYLLYKLVKLSIIPKKQLCTSIIKRNIIIFTINIHSCILKSKFSQNKTNLL